MATLNFAAQIAGFAQKTEEQITGIFRLSTQEVSSLVTANLSGTLVNVDTGFLRASQRASTESMPPIDKAAKPKDGVPYSFDQGEIALVIAGAGLGESIFLGWTAAYGPYLEFGTENIAPRAFVRTAAAQWQVIVNQAASQVRSPAGRL